MPVIREFSISFFSRLEVGREKVVLILLTCCPVWKQLTVFAAMCWTRVTTRWNFRGGWQNYCNYAVRDDSSFFACKSLHIFV